MLKALLLKLFGLDETETLVEVGVTVGEPFCYPLPVARFKKFLLENGPELMGDLPFVPQKKDYYGNDYCKDMKTWRRERLIWVNKEDAVSTTPGWDLGYFEEIRLIEYTKKFRAASLQHVIYIFRSTVNSKTTILSHGRRDLNTTDADIVLRKALEQDPWGD